MSFLLSLSRLIDKISEYFSRIAVWLVLLSCIVSAGNATIGYVIGYSNNARLEIQWHMFAGIVLLGAAYTLKLNEHVRVDVLYGHLKPRTQAWIDLLGMIFFLMPACLLIVWLSWPYFASTYHSNETRQAGGLPLWTAVIAIPVGFSLLSIQGISEIIKRIGFLAGKYNMDTHYERPLQ